MKQKGGGRYHGGEDHRMHLQVWASKLINAAMTIAENGAPVTSGWFGPDNNDWSGYNCKEWHSLSYSREGWGWWEERGHFPRSLFSGLVFSWLWPNTVGSLVLVYDTALVRPERPNATSAYGQSCSWSSWPTSRERNCLFVVESCSLFIFTRHCTNINFSAIITFPCSFVSFQWGKLMSKAKILWIDL